MSDVLNDTTGLIITEMANAVDKAWSALAGYKFWMFGYYAARWVTLNRLLPKPDRQPNPFRKAVMLAREIKEESHASTIQFRKVSISTCDTISAFHHANDSTKSDGERGSSGKNGGANN